MRSEVEAVLDRLAALHLLETGPTNALDHYLDSSVPTLAATRKPIEPRPILLLGDPSITSEISRYLNQSLATDATTLPDDDPARAAAFALDTSWTLDGHMFEERLSLFSGWQGRFLVVAESVVNPLALRTMNRICLALQIPWIHAAIDGPFLFIGPLFIPRGTSCYECFEARITMNLREAGSYLRYKEALARGLVRVGRIDSFPVLVGILASFTSMEIVNYALTESAFTVEKVLAIYLPTMELSFNEVLPVPGCPACRVPSTANDTELYFDMRALLDDGPHDDRATG